MLSSFVLCYNKKIRIFQLIQNPLNGGKYDAAFLDNSFQEQSSCKELCSSLKLRTNNAPLKIKLTAIADQRNHKETYTESVFATKANNLVCKINEAQW